MISSSSTTRIVPFRDVDMKLRSVGNRSGGRHVGLREGQREPRALPEHTVATNRPRVLVHDAVGDGQTKTGAPADGFRREERVVDSREMLGWHTRPGVAHLGDHMTA